MIITAAFAQVHADQVAGHPPHLVFVDDKDHQTKLCHKVVTQPQD